MAETASAVTTISGLVYFMSFTSFLRWPCSPLREHFAKAAWENRLGDARRSGQMQSNAEHTEGSNRRDSLTNFRQRRHASTESPALLSYAVHFRGLPGIISNRQRATNN